MRKSWEVREIRRLQRIPGDNSSLLLLPPLPYNVRSVVRSTCSSLNIYDDDAGRIGQKVPHHGTDPPHQTVHRTGLYRNHEWAGFKFHDRLDVCTILANFFNICMKITQNSPNHRKVRSEVHVIYYCILLLCQYKSCMRQATHALCSSLCPEFTWIIPQPCAYKCTSQGKPEVEADRSGNLNFGRGEH